jgi:hypothetical protein
MAYLTVVASITEDEVIRYREGLVETMAASRIERISHFLAYAVREQPLGKLVGEAIDGGEPLREDLWHPLRAPVMQNAEMVKNRWYRISEAWSAVVVKKEVVADDWYRIEISKLLEIFAHASRNSECIVSMLALTQSLPRSTDSVAIESRRILSRKQELTQRSAPRKSQCQSGYRHLLLMPRQMKQATSSELELLFSRAWAARDVGQLSIKSLRHTPYLIWRGSLSGST